MNLVNIDRGTAPDQVLENAKGVYDSVLVVGWNKEDALEVFSSSNMTRCADIVYLLEKTKHDLLNGGWGQDD